MVTTSARQKELLEHCASEPIHRLGRVQAFGMLLAIDARTMRVSFASANADAWMGRAAAGLLGQRADAVLTRRNVEAALAHADVARVRGAVQHLHKVWWPGRPDAVDVTIHASGSHVVLEAEPAGPGPDTAMPAVGACTHELAALGSIAELADSAVRAVAGITGYSRVMLYRFAADGSGTVIAEQLARRQPSYLGLRYPASDIPAQARMLYLRNLSRVVADVHDEGWPLLAHQAGELDLSLAALRSVSTVHLQYLRNMGTAASMSISLVVDGRLWGLIACHHHVPMRPPLGCRSMAEMLGRLYSLAFARAERSALDRDVKSLLLGPPGVEPLVDPEAAQADFDATCGHMARLLDLTSIVARFDGQTRSWGGAVTAAQARRLAALPCLREGGRVEALESLAAVQPGLRRLAPGIAGMLALPLGAQGRDCVMLLRDEVVRHVTWAGDPGQTVSRQRGRLCPRESFESWREAVRWHCEPWTAADIDLAEALRARLLECVLSRREHRALNTARHAAQQQALLVRELNHRVRNMLGLIKGLVQQTARSAASVDDLAERLHDRVQALSRAYTRIERAQWRPTALQTLLAEEIGAFAEPGQVTLQGQAVSLSPNAYLSFALVIHEMATNARKYGALSGAAGRLDVTWGVDAAGALVIDWRESGVPGVTPPRHRGFGTRVIAQALQHALGGAARLDFQPDGLRARLRVQRGFAAGVSTQVPVPVAARALPTAGAPNRVLVVEDDPVIAILAEESLHQLGVAQVDVAGNREEALALLAARHFDLAMLDVNLGDHTSEAVAHRLTELQVPMIVATGYSEDDALPDVLRGCPHLCKPYGMADLQRVLGEVPRR